MNTYTVQLWVTVDADNSEAAEAWVDSALHTVDATRYATRGGDDGIRDWGVISVEGEDEEEQA